VKQYGIVTERWHWERKREVKMWLVEHFGVNGDRWGEQYDYGLENLWMNEDVYTWYMLKWGS
jgi:hypothetical protein